MKISLLIPSRSRFLLAVGFAAARKLPHCLWCSKGSFFGRGSYSLPLCERKTSLVVVSIQFASQKDAVCRNIFKV